MSASDARPTVRRQDGRPAAGCARRRRLLYGAAIDAELAAGCLEPLGEETVLRWRHRLDHPIEPSPWPETAKPHGLELVTAGAVEGALRPLLAARRTSEMPLHGWGSLSR